MSYKKSKIPPSARTAITRKAPSALARTVSGLVKPSDSIFDWGCGKGYDLSYYLDVVELVAGWDPHFYPTPPPSTLTGAFNIVTCSCVLNVLQKQEREQCLKDISNFMLPGGITYFSVRTKQDIDNNVKDTWKKESDGWITSIGTFQHGFDVDELISSVAPYFNSIELIKKSPHIIKTTIK